jgi:hypothetical protein
MLRWCERAGVSYIVGLAKNERLHIVSAKLQRRAERKHRKSGGKVRLFGQFLYKAKTWDKKRRVIAKAEHSDRGANPRYVVTNLEGSCQALYDELYCARGEMENRIKEQQLGLFSDRTSCHAWWANQFRLLLSSAAYVLLEALRRIGLSGTELARAQVGTIRLRLLKIGAVIAIVVTGAIRRVRGRRSGSNNYRLKSVWLRERSRTGVSGSPWARTRENQEEWSTSAIVETQTVNAVTSRTVSNRVVALELARRDRGDRRLACALN